MPMPQNQQNKILPHDPTQPAIAKFPNWTTLPKQPITEIQCDYRMNCQIDVNGVGQVQMKPGYNANVDEIRYKF
jgi:hypothetical protein